MRARVATGLVAVALILGAAEPAIGTVRVEVVSRGPAGNHAVALTFDDAWDPGATRRLLEILAAAHVRATFFPVAAAVARDPALWREVGAAGHVVGNHTVDHRDLRTLDDAAVASEISDARTTVDRALGSPSAPLLRPPYGSTDERVDAIAARLGYRRVVLWDVASLDWTTNDPSVVLAHALTATDGSIVLMHAGPASTLEALPAVISGLRARGFALVTVTELLGDARS